MGRRSYAFEVPSEGELESALEQIEGAFVSRTLPPTTERLVYLDTFDRRIQRAGGWLYAAPESEPATLLWAASGKRPVVLEAVSAPAFAEDLPVGPVRTALAAIVAPRRLLPVAEVLRQSRSVELLDEQDRVVCRVTAIASALADPDDARRAHHLVLERVADHPQEYRRALRFLRDPLRLTSTGMREIDPLLAGRTEAAGRPPTQPRVALAPSMSRAEALGLISTGLWDVMLAQRDGMLADLDTEFLHDFRVALRRTRSILSQLGDHLPEGPVEHFTREFRWLAEVSGPLRDLDVLLLKLPEYGSALSDDDRTALARLETLLREDRRAALAGLVEALLGERFQQLTTDWKSLLHESVPTAENGGSQPMLPFSTHRAWKRYRKVRSLGRRIEADAAAGELHALRIRCKKLRYLLEVLRDLRPEELVQVRLRELRRLQDALGDLNDVHVHAQMLRDAAERIAAEDGGGASPAHEGVRARAIVAIGLLIAGLERRRAKVHARSLRHLAAFVATDSHERFRKLLADRR